MLLVPPPRFSILSAVRAQRIRFLTLAFLCCMAVATAQPNDANPVILVGVNGIPPHAQTLLDEMTDFLTSKHIKVKQVDDNSKSRTQLVEVAKSTGAKSLLYFTATGIGFHESPKLTVHCFDTNGTLLWKEETGAGPTFSPTGAAKKLGQNMKKKLEPHLDALGR
jgi:hypothetical protein